MLRRRLAALTACLVLLAPAAHAEESRFSDRFFRGTSPGELPTAKVAVVGAFYVAAVASLSLGVASLLHSADKGDDAKTFKHEQERGFCNDMASPACASYRDLLDEQRSTRNTGLILLGAGGLLGLGGALTAELWHNDALPHVAVGIGPHALRLGFTGTF